MLKPMLVCVMLSAMLIPTACQTTFSETGKETICLALSTADPLQYLDANDKRLIRESFSRSGKDGQKMALAIKRKIGCPE